jgi:signal peptidase I
MTLKRLSNAAVTALLIAGFAIGAVMLVPAAFGYQRFVITSGSMTGTVDPGSLVFSRRVDNRDLKVGDIITYTPPAGSHRGGLVTHRIVSISKAGVFRTKGDANPTPDAWTFTLGHGSTPRLAGHLPRVGYVYAALSRPELRRLVVGLPAILIALFTLVSFVRDARREEQAA